MESKKRLVFEKTREILSKYEVTGVSKNRLIQELQVLQIASRVTVLEYLPEMADPKRGNIIELRTPQGKITPLCFPTQSNLVLVKLKEKFKLVNKLLDLIEKYPTLGDGFIPIPSFKDLYKNNEKLLPDSGTEDASPLNTEIIHSNKTTFGESYSFVFLRVHKARHDLLKELPIFLTWYLNQPRLKYSKQIKEECIKILTPIFLRALKILYNDYSDSIHFSKQARELIQKTLPRDAAVITQLIKSQTMPHIDSEFLHILGRYYYTVSKQFSNKLTPNSSNQQRLVSDIIASFYGDTKISDEKELDANDIETIIDLCDDLSTNRDKEMTLKTEYGFDKNSVPIRLGLYNTDALHIRIYYMELFLGLGIFTKNEQSFLRHCLDKNRAELESLAPIDPNEGKHIREAMFPDSKYWNFG